MLAPDVFQSDIIFVERLDFRFKIAAQKAHEEIDFRLRPLLAVFFGEGVERQRRNSDACRGFDRRTHGGDAGAMSGDAGHVPPAGPAPVSVHDDGDMLGKTRWIEPQVNVTFLAVHPSRNRMSQVELSESKLTHQIQCVQCDRRVRVMECRTSSPRSYSADRADWTGETPVAPPALPRLFGKDGQNQPLGVANDRQNAPRP